jgi:hypothetical protein
MASNPVTATINLKSKTQRLLLAIVSVLILASIIICLIVYLTSLQTKRQTGLKQQKISLQQSAIANQRLADLAQDELQGIQLITEIFPDDQSIITVIQKLEALIKTFDPGGTVKFASLSPVKTNDQLSIPLLYHLRVSPAQGMRFLTELEHLPNVIQVKNVEIKTPQGASGAADMTLGALLYVKDPFAKSN